MLHYRIFLNRADSHSLQLVSVKLLHLIALRHQRSILFLSQKRLHGFDAAFYFVEVVVSDYKDCASEVVESEQVELVQAADKCGVVVALASEDVLDVFVVGDQAEN